MAVEWMTVEQYAEHRQLDRTSVSKMLDKVISRAAFEKRPYNGRTRIMINPIIADREVAANTNPNMSRKPKLEIPKKQGGYKPEEKAAMRFLAASGTHALTKGQKKAAGVEDDKPMLSEHEKEMLDLAIRKKRAETLKLESDAAKSRLDLEVTAGMLVSADDFEELYSTIVSDARDGLTAIKESARVEFPDVPTEFIDWLDSRHREFLATIAVQKKDKKELPGIAPLPEPQQTEAFFDPD